MNLKKYNSHTEPLFKKLHMLKVEDIFKLIQLKFFYKFINKDLPDYFKDSVTVGYIFVYCRFIHLVIRTLSEEASILND